MVGEPVEQGRGHFGVAEDVDDIEEPAAGARWRMIIMIGHQNQVAQMTSRPRSTARPGRADARVLFFFETPRLTRVNSPRLFHAHPINPKILGALRPPWIHRCIREGMEQRKGKRRCGSLQVVRRNRLVADENCFALPR